MRNIEKGCVSSRKVNKESYIRWVRVFPQNANDHVDTIVKLFNLVNKWSCENLHKMLIVQMTLEFELE